MSEQNNAAEIMLAMVLKTVGGEAKVTKDTSLEDVEGIEVIEQEDGVLIKLVTR